MSSRAETLPSSQNPSLTIEQVKEKIDTINRQQKFILDLARPNGDDNSVNVDLRRHPELFSENRKLSYHKEVFSAIYEAGRGIEGLFDQEVRFAKPPKGLTSEVLQNLKKRGLDFVPNPAFPVTDPEELEDIVDGRNGSALLKVFPEDYFRWVLKGKIAYPNLSGYYMAVDSPGPVTELSRALDIENLHTNSMGEINSAIINNEKSVLPKWRVPEESYIRALTAKELLILDALKGEGEHRVTHTRIKGTTDHIVFDGKDMSTRDRSEVGIPPRLAIIFSTRPTRVDYLKQSDA